MKTVLITGACGNIGAHTTDLLLERGYRVRALDLGTDANQALAEERAWAERLELFFGDICDRRLVDGAMSGVDVVLHLAAVIPPGTEGEQWLGYRVNVLGTRGLIEACLAQPVPPRFVYSSTAAVFGRNAEHAAEGGGPRRANESPEPSDNYSRQKLQCEQMLSESGLDHVIFRLAMTPPLNPGAISPLMFEMHADTRVEFTHPLDLALGLVNSLLATEMTGVYMLGGGEANRYHYGEWVNMAFESLGIGPVPREAFGDEVFLTDWLDSETSNAVLDYQRRDYATYLKEIREQVGPARHLIPAVAPIARAFVLANSRAYAETRGKRSPVVRAHDASALTRKALRAAKAFFR